MRIAMWSGPRNLSTAMMYAFGNRADCAIWDEPFYAPYLAQTGVDHPMTAEIQRVHETDPNRVSEACTGSIPGNKPHFYMKHMPHHMLPDFPLGWAADCVNVHLIRHPARVIASYGAKRDRATIADIGFEQQVAIYERFGGVVIDSADIRADPDRMLRRLCAEIGLAFDPAMLSWPAGPRAADGVWAAHWYDAVHRSTGFAGAEGPLPGLTDAQQDLCDQVLPAYHHLAAKKIA